jgi:hypothetical protein
MGKVIKMKIKTKTPAPIWLMFPALLALGGCSSTADGPATPAPTEWQQVDSNCDFFFKAPPEMKRQDVSGIDSCVGQYLGAGMDLSYDYGGYSDPLDSYSDNAEYAEESATIDGFDAKVIRLKLPNGGALPYVVAAHFADIGKNGVKLTMWINCKGPAEVEMGRQILDSISFP